MLLLVTDPVHGNWVLQGWMLGRSWIIHIGEVVEMLSMVSVSLWYLIR